MIDSLMRPPVGGRILDLGCGAADVLHLLPLRCEYTGVDANARHIEAARAAYGSRGTFLCGDFSLARHLQNKGFDLVIMLGLLHHLDDDEAVAALRLAGDLLAPGGRVFTLDPCRAPDQHPIARFLINRDSGQAVRDEPGYRRLAELAFPRVEVAIRHDLLRLPYTHCIMNYNSGEQAECPTF
ncbi:class I SAM-dependent methyltransferase [Bradyrhizobium ottawaense]|uniref:class I SAM-dependent methyltransferase n=1 Tax=Bradyrhizobium ottawaense TaxID=931866 RepID=UPI0009B76DF6|nr:class I SAM-dependent methyltransferase [Bradyrhizobium ottawaense]